MQANNTKILHGAAWGARLCEVLPGSAGAASGWMQQHTQVLKNDVHSKVGLLDIAGRPCCLKLYIAKSGPQRWVYRAGFGRPVQAYRMARALRAAGIFAPEPLSCLWTPSGMLLLTEGLSGAHDLHWHWEKEPQGMDVDLLDHAGTTLGMLHQANFAHGDFKWSNLLWHEQQVYLADLEAVCPARFGSSKQYRDVARFTLNAEDRGVPPERYDVFVEAYLKMTATTREQFIRRTLPVLRTLRLRHLEKYGQRGHQLL